MKCANCGKEFRITYAGWGYAYGGHYVCSYSCMRAMEREDCGMTDEQKAAIDRMVGEGKSPQEISAAIGADIRGVNGYISAARRKLGRQAAEGAEVRSAESTAAAAEADGTRDTVVRLIRDMLEVLKKLYGL